MNWLVRTLHNVKDGTQHLLETKFDQTVGTATGTTAGLLSSLLMSDMVMRFLFAVACAAASLLVSHYGKKILEFVDRRVSKWFDQ